MGAQALLCFDIENGEKVVEALDKAGIAPNVALWAILPDYEDWRLVIASDLLDQSLLGQSSTHGGYSEIVEAIRNAGIPPHRQPTIFLRPMDNPMIRALREDYASMSDNYGMRIGSQMFGDKFIEDGVVYRIR
jgi:hypothetical protein